MTSSPSSSSSDPSGIHFTHYGEFIERNKKQLMELGCVSSTHHNGYLTNVLHSSQLYGSDVLTFVWIEENAKIRSVHFNMAKIQSFTLDVDKKLIVVEPKNGEKMGVPFETQERVRYVWEKMQLIKDGFLVIT